MIVGLANLTGGARVPDSYIKQYCQVAYKDELFVSQVFEEAPDQDSVVWGMYGGDNALIRCAYSEASVARVSWKRASDFIEQQARTDAEKWDNRREQALASAVVLAENTPQGRIVKGVYAAVALLAGGLAYLRSRPESKVEPKAVPVDRVEPKPIPSHDPCQELILQAIALYCQLHVLVSSDSNLEYFISQVQQGNNPTYRGNPAKAIQAHLLMNQIAGLVNQIMAISGCYERLQATLQNFKPLDHCAK